jgi:hypothetical protein
MRRFCERTLRLELAGGLIRDRTVVSGGEGEMGGVAAAVVFSIEARFPRRSCLVVEGSNDKYRYASASFST